MIKDIITDECKLCVPSKVSKESETIVKGLAARIVQHEMDHLNGVLI